MFLIENRFVIIFFFFLALLSSWGFYLIAQQHKEEMKKYGHYPDSIAFDITALNFDDRGFLNRVLRAHSAFHYPDTKTTELTTLSADLFNQNNHPPFLITAPNGTAYANGTQFNLHGAVHMQQALQIDTSNLTAYTDQKYLLTAAPVHMSQPGLILDAVGARYDYEQQLIHLLRQVHLNYQPTMEEK